MRGAENFLAGAGHTGWPDIEHTRTTGLRGEFRRRFHDAEFEPHPAGTCLSRNAVDALAPGVKGIAGDLAEPSALGPAPPRVEYAVFAVGADGGTEKAYRHAYLDGLAGFLQWLLDEGQRPKRIVMTSSTSVYGQRRGEIVQR